MRDLDGVDSELRLGRIFAVQLGSGVGRCRPKDVVDALLDERRELTGLPRLTRCLSNY